MNWGAFKEVYNGQGIYFRGTCCIEGNGSYATIGEAREAIDKHNKAIDDQETLRKIEKINNGAIKVVRNGDCVTIYFPDGPIEMGIRQYRREVLTLEEKYNTEFVIVNP